MGQQIIRCMNCVATKWYIIQDKLLQSIKEMKVRASWSAIWEWNADGALHHKIIYSTCLSNP